MVNKRNRSLFLVIAFAITAFTSEAKTRYRLADSTPVTTDAKAIVSDYIKAIGGIDAIKKINTVKDTGNFSVQGMSLPVVQKHMVPNKTLQMLTMNGMTVGKTVFDGTKGFQEQMGNKMDMSEDEMTDMKAQTSVIPQTDYLTNPAFKLAVLGTEKVDSADTYKIMITMPSGSTDTEYYSIASKLLVKQIMAKTQGGQSVSASYTYGDYRKAGDVLMPYKQTLTIMTGTINQSIDILISDIKINEGVADTDFQ